jgi:molybdenum cofactor sulfurtransferase
VRLTNSLFEIFSKKTARMAAPGSFNATEPDADFFAELRRTDYANLDAQQQVYLDYTGGNLVPKRLLDQHHQLLSQQVLGNPHSTNPSSQTATQLVEASRQAVLDFFNAGDDYFCIFTANASGALKIVGESYPFNASSTFILTSDNHNSVNGIREFCKGKGGTTQYATVHYDDLCLDEDNLQQLLENAPPSDTRLFAFPAQSNVSGIKHDLSWIAKAQALGFDVLLDAAAYVPTSKLDLQKHQPDFVSASFYKIFGYPTGLGCLLVKKNSFHKLVKPWFAGGTVTMVSVVEQQRFLAEGHERFEDGTLSYNTLPVVKFGLDYIREIGHERIGRRLRYLSEYLYQALSNIKHENGQPVVKIFGTNDFSIRGGNLLMNFFKSDGSPIPFEAFEQEANARGISIRSGCFCNPGIDEISNCITHDEMAQYFSGREKGDYHDMVAYLGKMRGAIRASVGVATNVADLDAFLALVQGLQNRV